ncbi:hypothetical protein KCV01_g8116, partial [Aureobasidium melanogenum]
MSHDECQTVWRDLIAFEHSGQSFRPTALVLARVWKWLLEIAYANAVNLAEPVQKEIVDKMLDGEDEWPRSLVDAIFSKLSGNDQSLLQLQQHTTVKWVGTNTLESYRQNNKQSIMDASGLYKLSGGGKRIEFVHNQSAHAEEATAGAPKPSTTKTAGKRKWHEKFAAARKQGKPS